MTVVYCKMSMASYLQIMQLINAKDGAYKKKREIYAAKHEGKQVKPYKPRREPISIEVLKLDTLQPYPDQDWDPDQNKGQTAEYIAEFIDEEDEIDREIRRGFVMNDDS